MVVITLLYATQEEDLNFRRKRRRPGYMHVSTNSLRAFPCIRDCHVGQSMTGNNHRLEHSLLNDSARTPNNRALAT